MVIALGGYSQRVQMPGKQSLWDYLPGQFGKNFVEESGLFDSVYDAAFISPSRSSFGSPFFRNWTLKDIPDVETIIRQAIRLSSPSRVILAYFSDGGTIGNVLACRDNLLIDGVIAHSSAWPTIDKDVVSKYGPPVLVVVGDKDRTPVAKQQADIAEKFSREGRPVQLRRIPSLGHQWAKEENHQMIRDVLNMRS